MDLQAILNSFITACIDIAWKLLAAAIIAIIGNIIIRIVMRYAFNGKAGKRMDPTVRGYLRSLLKACMTILLVVIVVGVLGVPMASVIAVIAAAGAAVALALQGSLGNLASGIMLLIFRPFKAGQYIEADEVSGTVHDIGLFYTTLVTPDNKHITIPNGTLTSNTIINYSAEETRRVEVVYNVAYGTDIVRVKELIRSHALSHEKILRNPEPFIRMTEMQDSSIKFTLRVWCKNSDFWGVKFDLTEGIYEEFQKSGISIPFPQLDVHVKDR